MPLYKVWSAKKDVRKSVVAVDFLDFVSKGKLCLSVLNTLNLFNSGIRWHPPSEPPGVMEEIRLCK